MQCPSCLRMIAGNASTCPKCGYAFTRWYIPVLFILFVIIAVIFIAAASGGPR